MEDITIKITISKEHKDRLDALSDKLGVSVNELIERLVDEATEDAQG